jgi:hypothetical protein
MRTLLVLSALSLLAGAVRAEEGGPPVEPEFQKRVNTAIDRGAQWLLTKQNRADGSFPGFADPAKAGTYNPMDVGLNALVIQTLAHAIPAPRGKEIEKRLRRCFDFCWFHYSGGEGSWNLRSNETLTVYTAATLILATLAVHAPEAADPPPVKKDRYGKPQPRKPKPCKLKSRDKRRIRELVEFLVECQVKPDGGWRYPGNPVDSVEGKTDLSNTQYALLALDAAARCGFHAPDDLWIRAVEHLLREQEEEGLEVPIVLPNDAWEEGMPEAERFVEVGETMARGWGYLPGHVQLPTGSMTCAGVTCLAIAKERLWARKKLEPKLASRIDKGMLHGLAWLQDHFTVEDNPDPPNQWHYYYLYGLERTGAKTGVRWIGRHDWYREGADLLLAAQSKAGGWPAGGVDGRAADETESEITQTCFALLFLKRATQKPPIPLAPPVLTPR